MRTTLLPLLMFVVGAGVVAGGYALVAWLPSAMERRRLDARISEVLLPAAGTPSELGPATIVKHQIKGALPGLEALAGKSNWGNWLNNLISQAGAHMSVSTVVLLSLGCAAVGGVLVSTVFHLAWAAVPGGLAGASLPVLALVRKRNKRLGRFEEQFPEALDLLSRAIRAGHAFQIAMGMVADEAPDPIGPEFKKTFDEQNFGIPLKDALANFGERVPLVDVRFFVTAVLIQRETGGNLSEILDSLSHVVRERFKILRQVRVCTAHGRMTGYVLMALPAALAITLSFINPDHVNLLFEERLGHMMILAAIILQVVGYIWIRQVVKIEV
jgi:tight adherence protein B